MQYVHPFLRRNNWRAKNLALCGNFHITNVEDVFHELVSHGQHPRVHADTYIMLELMGHRLDREVERIYKDCQAEGLEGMDITNAIEDRMDVANVLRTSTPLLDGGYVFCDDTGKHLSPHTVYHNFKRIAASIGLPDARLHDLRHSYAVASIRAGDDIKTVQGNLGHHTAAFTLDVYGHVTEEMKQASAERMEQYIKSISGL